MNGEVTPPKLYLRRAKGYEEFRRPYKDVPRGSAGSFTEKDLIDLIDFIRFFINSYGTILTNFDRDAIT